MSSLFERSAAEGIVERLSRLKPASPALWGKMSVSQMLAHCKVPLQVALGERELKRNLVGIIFGKMAKRQLLKQEIFKKHLPTDPSFIVKGNPDFNKENKDLQVLIMRFASADGASISEQPHPFFGKMTAEEWGTLSFKHLDHHLRQFGA